MEDKIGFDSILFMDYPVVSQGCIKDGDVFFDNKKKMFIVSPDTREEIRKALQGQQRIEDDRAQIAMQRLVKILHGNRISHPESEVSNEKD